MEQLSRKYIPLSNFTSQPYARDKEKKAKKMKSSILNNLRSNLTREVPFFCKRRLGEVLSIAGTELALSECTSRLKYFFKQNTSSNPHPQL